MAAPPVVKEGHADDEEVNELEDDVDGDPVMQSRSSLTTTPATTFSPARSPSYLKPSSTSYSRDKHGIWEQQTSKLFQLKFLPEDWYLGGSEWAMRVDEGGS
ncbi:hypothetical protein M407DRAFT_240576 [Tulasnella calospora MUT 4182]|uniref:Uncharacterized protein n=1 Tax=Tulasnella calospora MUT 4182 TaxID=1051891 RepID=A0A0C3MM78_9AGAM|nr:hypothetical protein M407DRAFT_240576 [Tulasnella calospora MUT 4182]